MLLQGPAGAQRSRSRIRKIQHVSDLQTTVTRLQDDISALGPQVSFLRQKLAGMHLACWSSEALGRLCCALTWPGPQRGVVDVLLLEAAQAAPMDCTTPPCITSLLVFMAGSSTRAGLLSQDQYGSRSSGL